MDFVPKSLRFDVHVIFNASHPIDHERVRSSHIYYRFTVNLFSRGQSYPFDLSVGLTDFHDLSIEEELSAFCFRCDLKVMSR